MRCRNGRCFTVVPGSILIYLPPVSDSAEGFGSLLADKLKDALG